MKQQQINLDLLADEIFDIIDLTVEHSKIDNDIEFNGLTFGVVGSLKLEFNYQPATYWQPEDSEITNFELSLESITILFEDGEHEDFTRENLDKIENLLN